MFGKFLVPGGDSTFILDTLRGMRAVKRREVIKEVELAHCACLLLDTIAGPSGLKMAWLQCSVLLGLLVPVTSAKWI